MRRSTWWLLLAAAGLAVASLALRPERPDAEGTIPSPIDAPAPDVVEANGALREPEGRIEALPLRRASGPSPAPRVARRAPPDALGVSTYTPEELEQPTTVIFERVLARSEDWTADDFRRRASRSEALTGEEAYEVYGYLRRCLAFFHPDSGLPPAAVPAPAQAENCRGVPYGADLVLATLDWLTLAAERGYTQAEISYYRSARRLLTLERWLPYRHPQRVHAFRGRSAEFLGRAVASGHPDALTEYALALVERISFAEDLEMAWAYATVAERLAHDDQPRAAALADQLEAAFDAEQRDVARDLADSLWEAYRR